LNFARLPTDGKDLARQVCDVIALILPTFGRNREVARLSPELLRKLFYYVHGLR